jgi:selenocysteine lyase/cysteine desulfurase
MPFSVSAVQPDFLVAAAYKWLLGPYGLAFLYVRERFQDSRPIEHNWITRRNSEDFSGLVSYNDEFQEGAVRFDMGERSNFTLLPMAIAALEQIHRWTVPEIASTVAALTGALADGARELGLEVAPEPCRCPHLIGLRFPDRLPHDLVQELANKHIHVSLRGRSIRVSPHVYNTMGDVQRLLEVLERRVRTL